MKTIKGDLLKLFEEGKFNVIIHGCNCQNNMGSGIARSIREKYPIAYKADCATIKGDKSKLGSLSVALVPINYKPCYIINAYTQYNYGTHKRQVDYDALRSCFKEIKSRFGNHGNKIGYPMIGAGLAGGDWKIISEIIDKELDGEDHTVVIYQP